jgi:hypothetical protein
MRGVRISTKKMPTEQVRIGSRNPMSMPTIKTFSRAVVVSIALLASASLSSAATITAASPSRADVGAAVASANYGDTVVIPGGAATWNSQLTINKGITLQGNGSSGSNRTVITSNVPAGFFSFLIYYSPDATSISANIPFRVTGIECNGNGSSGSGCVFVENTTTDSTKPITKVRIDHNYFHDAYNSSYTQRCVLTNGMAWGVIDHNTFLNCQKTFDEEGSDSIGWAAAYAIGSANYMYFEDNTVTNAITGLSLITSGGQGGRYVVRHNVLDTTGQTDSGQTYDIHNHISDRGTVGAEIYDNVLTTRAGAYQFVDHRGGTGIIFNNRIIKPGSDITFDVREEFNGQYDTVRNTYDWHNTYGSSSGLENPATEQCTQGCSIILLNVNYWYPSFGLEANRPSSCSANTFWASTDTERIFKCTSANTWTTYYQSYTYPHPLTVSGSSGAPSAPTNLRIVP